MRILQCIKEWFLLTAGAFLLYTVLCLPVLRNKFDWSLSVLITNFLYCGTFILICMGVEYVVLRRRGPNRLTRFKLVLNGVLTLVLNLMLVLLFETLSVKFLWPDTSEDDFLSSIYIFGIVACIVSQFHIIRFYSTMVIKQQEENLALTKTILKSQLDPHFVLNSLNILTGLIEENPVRAERFIVSLSKIYRYIFRSLKKDLVSVSEAVIFAKEYVSVLQTRFPSSIDLCEEDLKFSSNEKILTMSAQLLIENAVKHNCPSPEHPLKILISRRGNLLVVSNSLYDYRKAQSSLVQHNGTGLKNLITRYSMECNNKPVISITGEGDRWFFEVSLPIIQTI